MIYHKLEDFPEEQRELAKKLEYWERFHPKTFRQLVETAQCGNCEKPEGGAL